MNENRLEPGTRHQAPGKRHSERSNGCICVGNGKNKNWQLLARTTDLIGKFMTETHFDEQLQIKYRALF